uniref:beta-1,3-galactosyltransferase 2-like n=1 Tax=Oncorhynchus gorbuscha TaxID=8017 RepID=UPI001EAF43E3|nr:beta-1,3-galactosyltransferase 2-like [Oncorhynchus gorbuscha]
MSSALMQSCTALSGRLYRRPCFLFILVAVAVSVTYTTFALNWWNDPQRPSVISHTGKTPDDDQVNPRVLTNRNGVQWEDPGRYHVAYPRGYKFIMDEPEKCRTGSQAPFLVLMAPVAPGNLASRDAIRRTWGNETLVQGKKVQTLFMLGLPGGPGAQELQEKVNQESRTHHDLLQSDFKDTYHNLTIKTMVILEWLVSRCPEASYAMKIDSDVFLNVQNLVSMLVNSDTPKQNYMTGLVWWHSPVLRNPNNKFFLPYEVMAESEYPPYPLGFGYIMSMDLPKKIMGVTPQIKPIYIEDAYLGMCLKRLGISPTNPPSKSLFDVNPIYSYGRCKLSTVVAVTTTKVSQLLRYWQDYTRPGPPC